MASWGTGWLIFDYGGVNETKLRVQKWEYDEDDKSASTIEYPSRGVYGWTMVTIKRTYKFTKVFVEGYANWNTLKSRLNTLQDTKTAINIKIQVHSNGTDFEKPDGTNDVIPVIIKKKRGFGKPYRGDAQFYVLKQLICVQAGALSS